MATAFCSCSVPCGCTARASAIGLSGGAIAEAATTNAGEEVPMEEATNTPIPEVPLGEDVQATGDSVVSAPIAVTPEIPTKGGEVSMNTTTSETGNALSGGPWGFGFGPGVTTPQVIQPAVAAQVQGLGSSEAVMFSTLDIRSSLDRHTATESLRHAISRVDEKVNVVQQAQAAFQASQLQREIDELRAANAAAAQGNIASLLTQILGKLSTPPVTT